MYLGRAAAYCVKPPPHNCAPPLFCIPFPDFGEWATWVSLCLAALPSLLRYLRKPTQSEAAGTEPGAKPTDSPVVKAGVAGAFAMVPVAMYICLTVSTHQFPFFCMVPLPSCSCTPRALPLRSLLQLPCSVFCSPVSVTLHAPSVAIRTAASGGLGPFQQNTTHCRKGKRTHTMSIPFRCFSHA